MLGRESRDLNVADPWGSSLSVVVRVVVAPLIAVLFALGGLGLTSAPAHAATTVSISLSPTTMVEGNKTRATGKVSGNVRRSVALQARRADGTWATAMRKDTDAAGGTRSTGRSRHPERDTSAFGPSRHRRVPQPIARP